MAEFDVETDLITREYTLITGEYAFGSWDRTCPGCGAKLRISRTTPIGAAWMTAITEKRDVLCPICATKVDEQLLTESPYQVEVLAEPAPGTKTAGMGIGTLLIIGVAAFLLLRK